MTVGNVVVEVVEVEEVVEGVAGVVASSAVEFGAVGVLLIACCLRVMQASSLPVLLDWKSKEGVSE